MNQAKSGAQLDRVLVSEAKGRGFDSRRARHISNKKAVILDTHGFFYYVVPS